MSVNAGLDFPVEHGTEHGTGTWDWNMGLEHGTGTWDWTKDARYTLLLISNSILSVGKFPTEQSKVS